MIKTPLTEKMEDWKHYKQHEVSFKFKTKKYPGQTHENPVQKHTIKMRYDSRQHTPSKDDAISHAKSKFQKKFQHAEIHDVSHKHKDKLHPWLD